MGFGGDFILSVRLSSRANEDRTTIAQRHRVCPSDDDCLGFCSLTAARLCAIQCPMFGVLCLVSTSPPLDFVDKCIAILLVSMCMKQRMSFTKSRSSYRC